MEFHITADEIRKLLDIPTPEFPRYASQILNLANQNAQATRPRVVGQMSELIQEFPGKTLEEWEAWYIERHPDAIDTATQKIIKMLHRFRDVMDQIDEAMVRKWVRDLVIVKTFIGLKFQEAILKKVAEYYGVPYKPSTPEEESKGIDGYLGSIPVSIKPATYQTKRMLTETIEVLIIFYEKTRRGIHVIVPEELERRLGPRT